jgi:hypothetical protein
MNIEFLNQLPEMIIQFILHYINLICSIYDKNKNFSNIKNYSNIKKVLVYKQLNPPNIRIVPPSYIRMKFVLLKFNVCGKGILSEHFCYDKDNNITRHRSSFYSTEQKKKDDRINKKSRKINKRRK